MVLHLPVSTHVHKEIVMKVISRLFPSALLGLNGLIYLWIGWLFLTETVAWFDAVGVSLHSSQGYTELRSVYGGFMAAFGVFLLICAFRKNHTASGILILVLSYAGLVAARSWGVLMEQQYNTLILQIYIGEWFALVLSIAAWFLLRRSH
jgi:hypothetical protein